MTDKNERTVEEIAEDIIITSCSTWICDLPGYTCVRCKVKSAIQEALSAERSNSQRVIEGLEEELKRRKEAPDFWKDIVVKDGELDFKQVRLELEDYYYMMEQVSKVYCHITGGLLSKQMYPAETVIAEADDHYQKYLEEDYLADAKQEVEEEMSDLQSKLARAEEVLKDWGNTQKSVMSEKCFADEVHCTCVPMLRKEIASLHDFLSKASGGIDMWHSILKGYGVKKEVLLEVVEGLQKELHPVIVKYLKEEALSQVRREK